MLDPLGVGGVSVAGTGEAGIEARVSHRGSFVYELKLPLVADDTNRWAPGLRPGDRFKLVIVNPQSDKIAEHMYKDAGAPGDEGAAAAAGAAEGAADDGVVDAEYTEVEEGK